MVPHNVIKLLPQEEFPQSNVLQINSHGFQLETLDLVLLWNSNQNLQQVDKSAKLIEAAEQNGDYYHKLQLQWRGWILSRIHGMRLVERGSWEKGAGEIRQGKRPNSCARALVGDLYSGWQKTTIGIAVVAVACPVLLLAHCSCPFFSSLTAYEVNWCALTFCWQCLSRQMSQLLKLSEWSRVIL